MKCSHKRRLLCLFVFNVFLAEEVVSWSLISRKNAQRSSFKQVLSSTRRLDDVRRGSTSRRLIPPRLLPGVSLLNLFASSSNDDSNNEGDRLAESTKPDDAYDDNDHDFESWVESNLKTWPLIPQTAQTTTDTNKEEDSTPEAKNQQSKDGKDSQKKDAIKVLTTTDDDSSSSSLSDDLSFVRSPLSRVLNIALLESVFKKEESQEAAAEEASKKASNTTTTDEEESPSNASSSSNPISATAAAAATVITNNVNLTVLEELSGWDKWVTSLKLNTAAETTGASSIGKTAEVLLRQATNRIEALVTEASTVVSPIAIEGLVRKSSGVLGNVTSTEMVKAAQEFAESQGLDVNEAADRAKETTDFASSLLRTADGLYRRGYVAGDRIAAKQKKEKQSLLQDVPAVPGSRALFDAFESVSELNTFSPEMVKTAEMGALSGAIYEETIPRTRALGHTIVARGTTQDVVWMVTDTVANRSSFDGNSKEDMSPFLVRTITVRGFDASDEDVDRDLLLNRICTAHPVSIKGKGVSVHSGLLDIASSIFEDVRQYIDWTAPAHKIVLNGHSVGGSISVLLLLLMEKNYGVEFVKKKMLKCFTFGSPPVAALEGSTSKTASRPQHCDILDAFDLPASLVHGYVQPWDPLVRLFSDIDALYPLVGNLGKDGNTPWADGPPRALRGILKSVVVAWTNWPRFSETFQGTGNQTYTCVGVQHVLLADPTRYLADRFLAVNIPVPPVETVLRISHAHELYPALVSAFPLDVFDVSFVPQAIRSFVHHFYPAYGFPLVDYVKELQRQSRGLPERPGEFSFSNKEIEELTPIIASGVTPGPDEQAVGIDWGKATQWLTGTESKTQDKSEQKP